MESELKQLEKLYIELNRLIIVFGINYTGTNVYNKLEDALQACKDRYLELTPSETENET